MTPEIPLWHFMAVSAVLFSIGVLGVLIRREAIIIFLSIELMLNAANLALVAFARYWAALSGQVLAIFIMSIAAAEAAVGLGVMIALFRNKETLNMDDINIMKG